jgi:hypothetical protein
MTALSLFSGIGGLDIAFEAAGGRVVAMCERDNFCRAVLRKHWPDVPIFEDVKTLRGEDVLREVKKYESVVSEYASGLSIKTLAEKYGITRQAMYSVLKSRKAEFRVNLRHGSENHFFRGGPKAVGYVHNLLEQAIEDGIVTRRYKCEICGIVDPRAKDGRSLIQAHHHDYNRPYDVMWLCQKCHHQWHKNKAPREVMPVKEASQQLSIDFIYGGFPQRGNHANPSAWRVTKKDGTTTDTFGLNFRGWSEKLDRFGSLLKTYLESLILPQTTFVRTWSVSATASGFGVMRLRLSVPTTGECGFFLWLTPKANDPDRGSVSRDGLLKQMEKGRSIRLQDQVNHPVFFRTPDAGCARGVQSPERFAESMKKGRLLTLNDQVAHLFPTPTANDAKNNATPSQRTENGRNSDALNVVAGGPLNPAWVEWLMGFPLGWTDLSGGEASPTLSPEPPAASLTA